MTKDKAKFTQGSICFLSFPGTCLHRQLLSSAYTNENVSAKDKIKYLLEKI